jgi:spermidine synthase
MSHPSKGQGLGRHILAELLDCDREILDQVTTIEAAMCLAAQESGATLIQSTFHHFSPYGVSGVVVIQESHLAIHTWPEYGYAAVDLFTCGDTTDPWSAFESLKKSLQAKRAEAKELVRGELSVLQPGSLKKTAASEQALEKSQEKPEVQFSRNLWFTDRDENQALSLRYRSGDLFFEKSPHQSVRVLDTHAYGRALALNNRIMCTERDEAHYHEMVVHPAFQAHGAIRRVLLIGGGDGGILFQVLRYAQVTEVDLVEFDETVLRASRLHLPWAEPSFNDPRVKIHIEDGSAFVARLATSNHQETRPYDAILLDGYDPDLENEIEEDRPFNRAFFKNTAALLAPEGIFATQGESPLFRETAFLDLHQTLCQTFGVSRPLLFFAPTLPTGIWSIQLARKKASLKGEKQRESILSSFEPLTYDATQAFAEQQGLRYYDASVHRGALSLPRFVQAILKQ